MYRPAHRWFAAGFSGVFALVFGFTLPSMILMICLGLLLGPLPDADQHFTFLTHRGGSHKFRFALIIAIPLSIIVIYVCWLVNEISGVLVFSATAINVGGVWVLSGFYYIATGDIIAFLTDPFFLTFLILFLAIVSHMMLDIITPSGLEFFGHKISGGILSNDPATNKLFETFGILLIVISLGMGTIRFFSDVSIFALLLMLLLFIMIIGVFFYSDRKKGTRYLDKIQCYNVNGTKFCTDKKCVVVMGKKICISDD